jgi:hypothetical protein
VTAFALPTVNASASKPARVAMRYAGTCPAAKASSRPAKDVEDRAVQGGAVAGVGALAVVEQDQAQPVTPELLRLCGWGSGPGR